MGIIPAKKGIAYIMGAASVQIPPRAAAEILFIADTIHADLNDGQPLSDTRWLKTMNESIFPLRQESAPKPKPAVLQSSFLLTAPATGMEIPGEAPAAGLPGPATALLKAVTDKVEGTAEKRRRFANDINPVLETEGLGMAALHAVRINPYNLAVSVRKREGDEKIPEDEANKDVIIPALHAAGVRFFPNEAEKREFMIRLEKEDKPRELREINPLEALVAFKTDPRTSRSDGVNRKLLAASKFSGQIPPTLR